MVNLNRMLCPVDFSPCSRRALDVAVAQGQWYGASVTVVHVLTPRPAIDAVPLYRGEPLMPEDRDLAALREDLEAFVRQAAPGWPVESEILEATDVPPVIVSHADALGADLVVMGTHGRSGLPHLLLGSIAEKVVRHARTPVLLVPPGAGGRVGAPFGRIVCAVDFAATSRHAVDLAVALAAEADAQLTLLHAIEVPPELQAPVTIDGVDVAATRAAAEAEALQRLRDLVPPDVRAYCTVHTDVREGRGERAIVDVARERQADVIVMGIHGHNALDRLVFGAHTHAVLHDAPCPVLAVPPIARPQANVRSGPVRVW